MLILVCPYVADTHIYLLLGTAVTIFLLSLKRGMILQLINIIERDTKF